jgi:hypothetical protein
MTTGTSTSAAAIVASLPESGDKTTLSDRSSFSHAGLPKGHVLELHHSLGKLPEPELTHDFF